VGGEKGFTFMGRGETVSTPQYHRKPFLEKRLKKTFHVKEQFEGKRATTRQLKIVGFGKGGLGTAQRVSSSESKKTWVGGEKKKLPTSTKKRGGSFTQGRYRVKGLVGAVLGG